MGSKSILHLVEPFGFDLSDKQVRRAGLDYWEDLTWHKYSSLEDLLAAVPDKSRMFFFTTKSQKSFYEVQFRPGDWLVFGKETKGLDEKLLKSYWDQAVTIPFPGKIRSFNLANAVAMAIGEGIRQSLDNSHA